MTNRIVTPRDPPIDLIRILSEGTYTSFPQALKEFISNSYDADATEVALRFEDDFSALSILDDGEGMTADEFTNVFASIARTGRKAPTIGHGGSPKRDRIGRFGIGALAVVGTADRFSIRSVKRGSGKGFEASIDLADLRAHYEKGEDLKAVWRFALSEWEDEKNSTHFTEIIVEAIRDDIRHILERGGKSLSDPYQSTTELSGLEELRWQLGVICPLEYAHEYPVAPKVIDPKKDRILIEATTRLKKSKFQVSLNQQPVRNPTFLPSYDPKSKGVRSKGLLKRGLGYEIAYLESAADSKVTYKGYLCVQAYQVVPSDLRGILVRLRGVAVGWHRTLHLGASVATMLTSMSGEVWVDGLDEALQFDRESFREDHPLFVWLRDRIQEAVDTETTRFRNRSAKRIAMIKRARSGSTGKAQRLKKRKLKARKSSYIYLEPDILETLPTYITRLVPQLNGSYEYEWYEGAAMILRRLFETLIIELYTRRGWQQDVQDPATHEFLMLKGLIDKLTGDARLNMQSRTIQGLNKVKDLGDTAAHDFRIRIRKSDLDRIQLTVRLTCDRLVFTISASAPTP